MTNKLTGDARTALMADVATELTGEDQPPCYICSGNAVDCCATQRSRRRRLAGRPSNMTVRDLALIRQAVLTVIDEGDPRTPKDSKGNPIWSPQWNIYSANKAVANAARLRLVDAVQQYIVAHVKEGE